MGLRVPAMTSRSTLVHSVSRELRVLPYTAVVKGISDNSDTFTTMY